MPRSKKTLVPISEGATNIVEGRPKSESGKSQSDNTKNSIIINCEPTPGNCLPWHLEERNVTNLKRNILSVQKIKLKEGAFQKHSSKNVREKPEKSEDFDKIEQLDGEKVQNGRGCETSVEKKSNKKFFKGYQFGGTERAVNMELSGIRMEHALLPRDVEKVHKTPKSQPNPQLKFSV